jgi:hypothetical protein
LRIVVAVAFDADNDTSTERTERARRYRDALGSDPRAQANVQVNQERGVGV